MHLFVQGCILGVLIGGVYALMASGLTLAFGIMRVVNVAQGAMVVLGAYLSYSLFRTFHIDPFLSILLITPALFGVGVLHAPGVHPVAPGAERRGAVAAGDVGDRARRGGRALASPTRPTSAGRSPATRSPHG